MTPLERMEAIDSLDNQVFVLTMDGHLTWSEAMNMTNAKRASWMNRLTERDKKIKAVEDKARKGQR